MNELEIESCDASVFRRPCKKLTVCIVASNITQLLSTIIDSSMLTEITVTDTSKTLKSWMGATFCAITYHYPLVEVLQEFPH